ncbi:hypothetical protein AB1Y20_002363 [Prymnesium parvum]|uniref:Mitochondrial carrier protein n=1 Tax=Prymnesium parvum TaxID=97485 RepID=A0AB34JBJ1_PRYPA
MSVGMQQASRRPFYSHERDVSWQTPLEGQHAPRASASECPSEILLASGAAAGVVSRTLTAPLDRVKCLMQVGSSSCRRIEAARPLQTLSAIYASGGYRGFFQGNGANLIKVIPEASIRFWAYDRTRLLVCADKARPTFPERLAAGAVAGLTSCLFTYPLELVKTRIAVGGALQYHSVWHCLHHTASTEGVRALYKGLPTALVGIIPFSAIDLGLYETFKARLHARDAAARPLSVRETLACGGAASVVAQLCTYPLALAKTRLQASGMAGQERYAGLADCLGRAWRAGGLLGLFNGFTPNLLKALPSMSIGYVVFEWTKASLLRLRASRRD